MARCIHVLGESIRRYSLLIHIVLMLPQSLFEVPRFTDVCVVAIRAGNFVDHARKRFSGKPVLTAHECVPQLTRRHVCHLNVISSQYAGQGFAYTRDVGNGSTLSWSGISRTDRIGQAVFHSIQESRGIAACREIVSHPVEVGRTVFCFRTNAVRTVEE